MTESDWLTSDDPTAMLEWVAGINSSPGSGVKISDHKLRLWVQACRNKWPHMAGMTNLDDATQLHWAVKCWGGAREVPPPAKIAALLREVVGNPFKPVTLPPGPGRKCPRCEGDGWIATPDGLYASRATCKVCEGKGSLGTGPGPCPWLTPTVLMLAQSAYEQRGQVCPYPHRCSGLSHKFGCNCGSGRGANSCPKCSGTGTLDDGTLDPARLLVLSDALEEAGCQTNDPCTFCKGKGYHKTGFVKCDAFGIHDSRERIGCVACKTSGRAAHPIIAHLRSAGPHVRGCWAVDLIRGRE